MDIARHISRVYDRYYKDEKGRIIPWLKKYFLKLAEKYYLKFGDEGVFANPFSYTELDDIYIAQKEKSKKDNLIGGISKAQTKNIFGELIMKNPLSYPGRPETNYWKLNEKEYKKRARYIMERVTKFPRVKTLDILIDDTHLQESIEALKESLEGSN